MKKHFGRIVGDAKLTFEELTTVLEEIEACLNVRLLTEIPEAEDGIETLTPGHLLIGHPVKALPDTPSSFQSMTMLWHWRLCQALVHHFSQHWSAEYFCQLQKFAKWNTPSPNLQVGNIVCLRRETTMSTKWPLACVTKIHPGVDERV